jgi:hypothetical protein
LSALVQNPDNQAGKHVDARRGVDRFCWDISNGLTTRSGEFPVKKPSNPRVFPFRFRRFEIQTWIGISREGEDYEIRRFLRAPINRTSATAGRERRHSGIGIGEENVLKRRRRRAAAALRFAKPTRRG